MSRLRAVLWDADGVLQQVPGGWRPLLHDLIGAEPADRFLAAIWPYAQDAMCGRGEIVAALDALLRDQNLEHIGPRIREIWGTFERFDDTRELVSRVRSLGVTCHLATNQDQLRATYMRERLRYDDLMDSSFYSCDVGAVKPDRAFFEQVLDALGDLEPNQVAFVDDLEANVIAARDLGISAIHWHHRDGLAVLERALRDLGLEL